METFPDLDVLHVLDLGGTRSFWQRLPVQPASVTAVNVVAEPESDDTESWFAAVVADACDSSADFGRSSFDLVFSNSTIEHVGDKNQRQRFADNVHGRADRHWIQTPNRAFPIEPHVLFPLQQFLPRGGRALVVRYWPLVHTNATSMEAAYETVDGTDLLGREELTSLFPTSVIETEEVTILLPAKSLIAVKA